MIIEKFKGFYFDVVVDEKLIVFIKGGGDFLLWEDDDFDFD